MADSNQRRANTQGKVGATKSVGTIGKTLQEQVSNYYKRKNILNSEQYEKAHPDKVFAWVNLPKLQQNSFYHENGWRPFLASDIKEGFTTDQYGAKTSYGVTGLDNMVHRSEMVLVWQPREEYEEMKAAEDIARKIRDNGDFLKNKPGLEQFNVSVKKTTERVGEADI